MVGAGVCADAPPPFVSEFSCRCIAGGVRADSATVMPASKRSATSTHFLRRFAASAHFLLDALHKMAKFSDLSDGSGESAISDLSHGALPCVLGQHSALRALDADGVQRLARTLAADAVGRCVDRKRLAGVDRNHWKTCRSRSLMARNARTTTATMASADSWAADLRGGSIGAADSRST